MCYAIPIFANRVAPRYTIAEFMIFLIISGNKIISRRRITLKNIDRIRLMPILSENGADILVCGGISRENREMLENSGIMIIDNVCSSLEEVQSALEQVSCTPALALLKARIKINRPLLQLTQRVPIAMPGLIQIRA